MLSGEDSRMPRNKPEADLFASRRQGAVEVEGTVARITYRSEETGYTVARIAPEDDERTVAVVGKMPPLTVGERVRMGGQWTEHAKFGAQIQVERVEFRRPEDCAAIARYLGAGLAEGIGPRLAERIVERFGTDTLDVIDHHPGKLTEVSGISVAKARALADGVRRHARLRNLTMLLERNGLGARYAARIHDRYGDSALTVVREEPYRLARDIWGIGFVRADALARSLGVKPESPARVAAGIEHVLGRSAEVGEVYLPADELVRKTAGLLEVDIVPVEEGVETAVKSGRVVREEDRLYTVGLHLAETRAARILTALQESALEEDCLTLDEAALRSLQSIHALELSADQIEALRLAHERNVLVITGGPGTGKTTLTRFLLDLFEGHGLRLLLAAPTGRAARRLSETTGREASTIHRLLGFDPSMGIFGRDESNPLEADVLLVDETSMVDLHLFDSLLRALPESSRLVLVGDADQLPSVGPGEVLRDLLRSGCVPAARLTRIFRQGERSGIVENAHRILRGEKLEFAAPGEGDFVWVERQDPASTAAEVRRIVSEFLPKEEGVDPIRDVQVLVPMYKGEAGANELNRALQQDLNPGGRPSKAIGREFRVGDRVIQLKNDYQRNVFNGEIGRVEAVAEEGGGMRVLFDESVEIPPADWDQVALAYSITIHKAQGSEYQWVVIPLATQHAILLERRLFYTAITRARQGVILVGSRRALELANRPGRAAGRRTTLAKRIRGDLPA
jgi:exodeoxyribonuclease V alpha subunit